MPKMQEFSKAVFRKDKLKTKEVQHFSLQVRKRSHNRESARHNFYKKKVEFPSPKRENSSRWLLAGIHWIGILPNGTVFKE